jgi:hypothetical protein
MEETTNDFEQLKQYRDQLVIFIEQMRFEYIELLEEKKIIEFILNNLG